MNNQAEILRRCSQRRPHVVLAWDDTEQKIVAPPTQVGISWNNAFSCLVRSSTGLVDNFDVPLELFELSNLDEILTVKVWETCLSESEKELLSIYLPQGVDQDTAVRALLSGENLHFGNPFHTWGASVCSGAMHPDNLVKRESALRKSRKTQRKHFRSYHSQMLRKLQAMKDIWVECRNDSEVLPRIHRWLKSSQRNCVSPVRNGGFSPKRAKESDKAGTKSGRPGERLEDHQTTRKDKNTQTRNRKSAKRLKTTLVEDGVVDKEVLQSDFESDFFKKYVEVSVGALTRDQLSDITVPVKVTRKQFENLKSRLQAGEEVDFDSLDTEGDHGTTGEHDRKKNDVDGKEIEELKRHWSEQIVKSLPDAHAQFLERKARLLELVDSIARSCVEERAYVMRQNEEPCSPESVGPKSEEDRIPTDAACSGADDENLSQDWRGKHLLAGTVSEDADEEFNTQSPQEEAMDSDSAGEEADENSSDEKEARCHDVPSILEEKLSSNECSPVSNASGMSEDVENNFTPENTLKEVQPEESFESQASVMESTRPDDHEEQRRCGDNLPGYDSEPPSVIESVLNSGHHPFSSEGAKANFSLPEKQELQLLPDSRLMEVPNLRHLGPVPQAVQEPAELYAEHTQMSHQFENPIASLINFTKRQHQLNGPPHPPVSQHSYPPYSLPSSAPLPMAVPVVELAPMWPGTIHRPSPASTQFSGGLSGSWPVPENTHSGGGWGLSEALQNASRRAQLQVTPGPPAPAPPAPLPRWDVPNQNVYPNDPTARKPERVYDQQQFYTDWSSRAEFPGAPTAHSEPATAYRAPSWYPSGPFDNVGNLSGIPMQHLPLQRHPLWPPENAPPKPVPQLWGNMNWRPT